MPCHPFMEQEKSPGRLSRPIKVKNLTKQKKVKEWIQILPPTRTATSKAILIIMMKTQMQVRLEIYLKQVLKQFYTGMAGQRQILMQRCLSIPQLSLHRNI